MAHEVGMRLQQITGRRHHKVNIFGRPLTFRVGGLGEAEAHRRLDYVELRLLVRRFEVVRSPDLLVAVSPGPPWVGKDPVRNLQQVTVRREGDGLLVEITWRTAADVRLAVGLSAVASVAWVLAHGRGAVDLPSAALIFICGSLMLLTVMSGMAARGVNGVRALCRGEDLREGSMRW